MVETSLTKYHLLPTDLTTNLSLFTTRKKSTVLLYSVVFIFVLFTLFFAFTPSSSSSSSSSSHWFLNIFTLNSTSHQDAVVADPPRSRSPSIFSYFFPDDDHNVGSTPPKLPSQGQTFDPDSHPHEVSVGPSSNNISKDGNLGPNLHADEVLQPPILSNSSRDGNFDEMLKGSAKLNTSKDGSFEQNGSKNSNGTTIEATRSQNVSDSRVPNSSSPVLDALNTTNTQVLGENGQNVTESRAPNSSESVLGSKNVTSIPVVEQKGENATRVAHAPFVSPSGSDNSTKIENGVEGKGVEEKVIASDYVASSSSRKGGKEGNLIEALVDCDLYDGEWVRDESYPLYKPGSCSLIDEQFNCIRNGRPDNDFHKLKWKPKGCTLPRLSGDQMLKFLKGKRLVFIGDSLNRNMWESLVCILRNSVKNKKKVFESSGRHSFRSEASYSFVFKDYNLTVEFFVAPFLVQQWDFKDKNGETKETLRLDLMVRDNDQFKTADFVVFNTGHWWTHEKTSKGEDYYQEGSHVHKQLDVHEAFRRAMTTWARWVDANINPDKTHVLFRGYSATHFRGGQWNSGGQCDSETEPIRNDTYLTPYPWKMEVFESIMKGMKTPVSYLNITRMTDYRKDGHPSIYRKLHVTSEDEKRSPLKYQDCSHWCLPGVPDSWNELLYAELLRKQYKDRHQQKKT